MEKGAGMDVRCFTGYEEEEDIPSQSERIFAATAQGAFFVGGLGYFLVPFVLWLIMRNKSEFVTYHAKQAWLSQMLVTLLFTFACILGALLDDVDLAVALCFLVGIPWFLGAIYAVVKALMGEIWHFPGLG